MNADQVSIVIPALNEEAAIAGVVKGLIAHFPESEIIVVDDGSRDATASIAREAGARVIGHDRNRGYGAALRTGTEAAAREYVLFCDSDGQHTPQDVGRVIEAVDGHDMIVGVRGSDSNAPLLRRPGKWILKVFANYIASQDIPDLNSGLRIVRRTLLLKYIHLMPQGFSFSTTSTFAMLKTNRHVGWTPIKVEKRLGTSTVKQWKHGPQTLMLMLRLAVLFEPLKVFLHIAAALFAATLASLAVDIFIAPGFGIGDTTVLLTIATIIVFIFGLVCDQVSALRREIHE